MAAALARRRPAAAPVARLLAAATAPLSLDELAAATGCVRHSIYVRLLGWTRAGLIAATPDDPRRYSLITSSDPLPGTAPRQSDARQRIWTAFRVLKCCDVPTLVMAGEASRKTVQMFLLDLQRAGYVRRASDGNRRLGALSSFALVRRSGPRAPTLTTPTVDGRRRRILIDAVTGERRDVTDPVVDGGEG